MHVTTPFYWVRPEEGTRLDPKLLVKFIKKEMYNLIRLVPGTYNRGELLYESIESIYLQQDGERIEEWDLAGEFRVLDVVELDMGWAEFCYQHREEKHLMVFDC